VALNATDRVIRLGSGKRSAAELVRDLPVFGGHVERFLRQVPEYAGWRVERVSLGAARASACSARNRAAGFARARSERPDGWPVSGYSQWPFFRATMALFPRQMLSTNQSYCWTYACTGSLRIIRRHHCELFRRRLVTLV